MLRISKFKNYNYISIAAFALVAMLFLSCQNNNIDKIKSFSHPPGSPEVIANQLEVLYSDSAIIRFKLTCPELKIYDDEEVPHKEFPLGFKIEQYNTNNQITSCIEALYGKYYEEKELWEAKQNVVAVTENNDTLKTELLYWDEKKDKIYSDQFVKFIRKEQIITGIGFESDLQMRNWKIINVKGTVIVEVEE